MLAALLGQKNFGERGVVKNANTINDPLRYPFKLDPLKTGRVNPKYNEAVLPFNQNREFYGTNLMPYMQRRPYLTEYRQWKRVLEVETATTDMLDNNLITYRRNFVGDYMCPYPDMVSRMIIGNSKLPKHQCNKRYSHTRSLSAPVRGRSY